jgi:hypothetical protein
MKAPKIIVLAILMASAISVFSQGKGNAVSLNGINGIIDCGDIDALDNTEIFTIEMWFNLKSWTNFADIFNKGNDIILMQKNQTGKIGMLVGTTAYVDVKESVQLNEWIHIAVVYKGYEAEPCNRLEFYINGNICEIVNSSCETVNQTPSSDMSFRVGSGHHPPESSDIIVDEVRVWSVERTQEEIRQSMCQKVLGGAEGLVAYYNFDDIVDFVVPDFSGNEYHAELINVELDEIVPSDAPVGDISSYLYFSEWINESVSLNVPSGGVLTVSDIAFSIEAIYLYQVMNQPINAEDIDLSETDESFWGLFVVPKSNSGAPLMYTLTYSYDNVMPVYNTPESVCFMARAGSENNHWSVMDAVNDVENQIISVDSVTFIVPEFFTAYNLTECAIPSSLTYSSDIPNQVDFQWISEAEHWDIEYGETGFSLGNGIFSNVTENAFTIVTAPNTLYDLYIKSNCEEESSYWFGPYIFSGLRCSEIQFLSFDQPQPNTMNIYFNGGNTDTYNLKWGMAPLNIDWAILTSNIQANPFTLSGLMPNVMYQFYVQSKCDDLLSGWVGPFSYTLLNTSSSFLSEDEFSIYPNPVSEQLTIYNKGTDLLLMHIFDLQGTQVKTISANAGDRIIVDVSDLSEGLYLVKVFAGQKTFIRKIVKSR